MFVKLKNNKPILFIAKSKNRSSENSLCAVFYYRLFT